MKTTMVVGLAASLFLASIVAVAQDSKPSLTMRPNEARQSMRAATEQNAPTSPQYCKRIIFYGGDTNDNDPNAQGFADSDTVSIPDTNTYGTVIIPAGHTITVTGLFFQMFTGGEFDAPTSSYDIRQGVSEGNGGTSIASGSGTTYYALDGGGVFPQYAVAVQVNPPVQLPAGQYWFNVTPQCLNNNDPNCNAGYYVNNTTQETHNVHGNAQPPNEIFFNSSYFGFNWANWCDPGLGQNSKQCARLSFGICGK
jgi:hypothetical protein